MKKLLAITAFALSMAVMAVPASAQDYYDRAYDVKSYDDMPDLSTEQRMRNGYITEDRTSTGSRENPLDEEAAKIRSMAIDAYQKNNDGTADYDTNNQQRKLVINYANYSQAENLDAKAAEWDAARKTEISQAQQYRERHYFTCGGDAECFAELKDNENHELEQIRLREEERNRKAGWVATAKNNEKAQTAIKAKYTNDKGQIEDVEGYANEALNSAFKANIVATAHFCMMDKSAARADPSGKCKKAICKVFGKEVCKAVF